MDRSRHTFLLFDTKDFYPSITESLLKEYLNFVNFGNFAKTKVPICKTEEGTILPARKSLLSDGSHVWLKKKGRLFDVTVGAFDVSETCELVGTCLLNEIGTKYAKENVGLYQDDGLAVFKDTSGPKRKNQEGLTKDLQR